MCFIFQIPAKIVYCHQCAEQCEKTSAALVVHSRYQAHGGAHISLPNPLRKKTPQNHCFQISPLCRRKSVMLMILHSSFCFLLFVTSTDSRSTWTSKGGFEQLGHRQHSTVRLLSRKLWHKKLERSHWTTQAWPHGKWTDMINLFHFIDAYQEKECNYLKKKKPTTPSK